jgi:hypothetical protein
MLEQLKKFKDWDPAPVCKMCGAYDRDIHAQFCDGTSGNKWGVFTQAGTRTLVCDLLGKHPRHVIWVCYRCQYSWTTRTREDTKPPEEKK